MFTVSNRQVVLKRPAIDLTAAWDQHCKEMIRENKQRGEDLENQSRYVKRRKSIIEQIEKKIAELEEMDSSKEIFRDKAHRVRAFIAMNAPAISSFDSKTNKKLDQYLVKIADLEAN